MLNTIAELFEEQIKDLYGAETQLTKALPKMIKAASATALKEALSGHLEETQEHVRRLEKVAEMWGFKPKGKVCAAMKGLVEEGGEATEEEGNEAVVDAGIIAAGQRVEHYEMSAYGTAAALAKILGCKESLELLQATLGEEKAADKKLNDVVMRAIYPRAPKEEEAKGDEDEMGESTKAKGGKEGKRTGSEKGGMRQKAMN